MDRVGELLGMPSRSAFIRAAVLEKVESVEQSKVVEIRDVTEDEAVRLIDRYLQKHPGVHYTSDIADELGIDIPIAFAATERLIERGRARVRGD